MSAHLADDYSAADMKAAYALILEAHDTKGTNHGRGAFLELFGYYPDITTYAAIITRARKDAGKVTS